MTDTATRAPARRDIQGLRALAVVAVVLAHAVGWPRGGFVGVDVFFVVSGFLITGLLVRELADTGRVSLRDFAARRARRILPAALLVLIVVVAVAFVVFSRVRADQTLGDAVAAALFVSNWRFAAEGTDYFSLDAAVSPLQHFWSLSVEEQFYLVWPVLLLLCVLAVPAARRRRGAAVVAGILAFAVVGASGSWAVLQTAAEPTVAYFSTATRASELAVGALLAAVAPVLRRLPATVRRPLGWVGVAGVIASFFVLDPSMPFPAPWVALPVAATALVIAGGVGGDPRQRHLLPVTNPLAVFVGDISYSLYLWHLPVIVFVGVLLPEGAATTGIVLGAIAVLAVTTYFGLEQPLHRSPWLRRRTARRPEALEGSPPPIPGAALGGPDPAASVRSSGSSTVPASEAPRLAVVPGSTRPAGWVPGSRYYPGSSGVRASSPPSAARDAARERPGVPAPAPAASAVSPVRTSPAPRETTPPSTGPTAIAGPWASWRARFAAQMGMAATGLVLGAGAIVVALFVTVGGPVLGPLQPPSAAPVDPLADDPTGALAEELAAAVSATEWPVLHPSLDEVIARSSADNPAHDCFAPDITPDPDRCTWGEPDAARHMYLVGDSSAMAYAPAFKRLAEESDGAWRVTTVGLYGCRFTDVLVDNAGAGVMAACPQRKLDVRGMTAADPADLVVVSNAYTLGHSIDGRDLDAGALLEATRAETAAYGASGGVVYLAPPPHGSDLARCYSPLSSPAGCLAAVDPTWHDMQLAAEATAAASGGHAVSSLPFSCVEDVCPAFAGGIPVRYDENHLTVAYAEHIVPWLRSTLASLGLY